MKLSRKLIILSVTGLLPFPVFAGNLDAPSAPTNAGSAMYSLQSICDRLDTGAAGSQNIFTEPTSGPGSTGCTLNEVMTKAPALDDTNGATPADVANGKTFWGLTSGSWGLQTGTASGCGSAAVPKTGQTISYATGDDGDLEKGVVWPSPRFTDNSNGTVTDNLTGLIWLKNTNCASATRNWTTALSDVVSLNSAGTMNGNDCGDTSNSGSHQTDWRLPNVKELQSLIDFSKVTPALPAGHPFSGVQPILHHSSTTYAGGTTNAWNVSLNVGSVNVSNKSNSYGVWPVRGEQ